MIYIKYILMFFVFLVSGTIGNLYSKKYSSRLNELEKINSILNVFKSKIKFTCLTIQEIFAQIYEDNHNNIGEIFKLARDNINENSAKDSWEKALEDTKEKTNLKEEDITVLKTLGNMLGNTDVAGQVSQIELTEQLVLEQIENAKIEKNKNSRLYKTLGVSIGLTIIIILI